VVGADTIIEESVEGLVTATGFSGRGFQHAPAAGMIVAELVFEGDAPSSTSVPSDGAISSKSTVKRNRKSRRGCFVGRIQIPITFIIVG